MEPYLCFVSDPDFVFIIITDWTQAAVLLCVAVAGAGGVRGPLHIAPSSPPEEQAIQALDNSGSVP